MPATMPKFKYVDEHANIDESEDPRTMLKTDVEFLSDLGIVEVSEDRWKEAQRYEASEWMERGVRSSDDRNEYHAQQFDNYKTFTGYDNINSIIELGCGPFTNLRIIDLLLDCKELTLLDPLIDTYLGHPNCTYGGFRGYNHTEDLYYLNGKPVTLESTSIEDFNTDKKYDCVVMINVLEHCRSIPEIFEKVLSLLNVGGFFVFADVYFEPEVIEDIAHHAYNAGHPIRITEGFLFDFLGKFNAKFIKVIDEKVAQRDAQEIYFIGTKI